MASSAILALDMALFAIVMAPLLAKVASPDIVTLALLAALPSTPMINSPFASPSIIESSITPFNIVISPLLAKVASPDNDTDVALLAPLPTKIVPLLRSASLVNAIAALVLISLLTMVLFTIPLASGKFVKAEPSPTKLFAVTVPVKLRSAIVNDAVLSNLSLVMTLLAIVSAPLLARVASPDIETEAA